MDYNISMPSKPKIVSEEGNKGVYEIDGLYAGYGHTLGNSLRRIILSSLPGAAITSIKIDGISHEFSTIPNIKEDVISIILNLKKVRFKMHGDEAQKAEISIKGLKDVKAKDIKTPTQLEILNPDQHIATLTSKNSELTIELNVEKGLGYVSKENYHKEKSEIGGIPLDAIFTPVKRVNYEVENMRVGDRTDYNRLRIFIETDGIISPREALEKSIEIMINHLRAVLGFQEKEEFMEKVETKEEKSLGKAEGAKEEDGEEETEALKTRVEDLNISSRTQNALSNGGIRTVGGLARKSEDDLLEVEGLGKKGIEEIKKELENLGLSLKQK